MTAAEEPQPPRYAYTYLYVDIDTSGYYHPRWDRATPIELVAATKDEALLKLWAAAGTAPRGRHWQARLRSVKEIIV